MSGGDSDPYSKLYLSKLATLVTKCGPAPGCDSFHCRPLDFLKFDVQIRRELFR